MGENLTNVSQSSDWQDILTFLMKDQKVLVVISGIPLSQKTDSDYVAFEQLVLIMQNFSIEE